MTPAEERLAALIPDPVEREAWTSRFRPNVHLTVEDLYPLFDDPDRAAAWQGSAFTAEFVAHLDRHNIPAADEYPIWDALEVAENENPPLSDADYDNWHYPHTANTHTRAVLILAHPHLTRADRDAIITAGLTLTEVDHLITTGTYDRDALTLIAGLT